jgi:phosphodiesterase/alkaline phosphatase D-like protein
MKKILLATILCLGLCTFGVAQTPDVQITQGPTETNVTGNSVDISWTTNVKGSSTIEYGTDRNNLSQTAHGGWGGPEHKVTLRSLQPNTTYYYRVLSTEGKTTGTGAIARVDSFTTGNTGSSGNNSGNGGSNPAEIQITSGPTVQNVTDKTAEIYWVTNTKGSSTVQFGTDPNNLVNTAHGGWGGPEHRTRLGNLKPGTTYYYRVLSKDAVGSGDDVTGTVQSFQTSGTSSAASPTTTTSAVGGGTTVSTIGASNAPSNAMITAGPYVRNVGRDNAEIYWTSNAAAPSTVFFGTDRTSLNMMAQSPVSGTSHSVVIPNLRPDTVYYVRVQPDGSTTPTRVGTSVGTEKIIGFKTSR